MSTIAQAQFSPAGTLRVSRPAGAGVASGSCSTGLAAPAWPGAAPQGEHPSHPARHAVRATGRPPPRAPCWRRSGLSPMLTRRRPVCRNRSGARMTDEARVVSRVPQPEDRPAPDWSPTRLSDVVGQAQAVQRLKPRGRPLPHILLTGAEGTGKRTLAAVLANEMGVAFVTTAGPSLERGADLMGVLTNLAERDVLFMDQIHRLPRAAEELLSRDGGVLDQLRDGQGAQRSDHAHPAAAVHASRSGREGRRGAAETTRSLPGYRRAPGIL